MNATATMSRPSTKRPYPALKLAREIIRSVGVSQPRAETLTLACIVENEHKHDRNPGVDAVMLGDIQTFEEVLAEIVMICEQSPSNVACSPEQVVIDVTDFDYQPEQGEQFTFTKRSHKDWAPVGGWVVQATGWPEEQDGRKLVVFELEVVR